LLWRFCKPPRWSGKLLFHPKKTAQHGREQFNSWNAAVQAENATKERAVLENTSLTSKGKTSLLAVLRMEQIAGEDAALVAGFSYSVDRRGIVLFALPCGGMIKDTGKELFFSFSPHDTVAAEAALRYTQKNGAWSGDVKVFSIKNIRRNAVKWLQLH
jgi:hypothetical protein